MKYYQLFFRYAGIVGVGDSILIENQNEMAPAKVEYISVHANEGTAPFESYLVNYIQMSYFEATGSPVLVSW